MSSAERPHPGADMEGFVRDQMAFVGLGDADVETIRHTAPLVLKHGAEITTALYDHFLKFPETKKFFVGEDGLPDLTRIERRKHSLARWLRESSEVAMTHGFVYYLLAIALSHSHREYGPGGKIPSEFMVGAMSLAQTAIAGVLREELADPREALEAAVAWNKLLLVHLNVLLLGYLLPPREARD